MKMIAPVTLFGMTLICIYMNCVHCAAISTDTVVTNEAMTGDDIVKLGIRLNKPILRLIGSTLNLFLKNITDVNIKQKDDLAREMCRLHPCTEWSEWTKCDASGWGKFGGQNRNRTSGYNSSLCQGVKVSKVEYETKVCQRYCRENYTFTSHGFCIKLYVTDKKTRQDAESVCVADGGYLINIDSAVKQGDVESMLAKNSITSGTFYIDGLRTVAGGDWAFSSPSTDKSFAKWHPSEPSNASGELCKVLEFHSGWVWCDRECTNSYNYICEIL